MPRQELHSGAQVEVWLDRVRRALTRPGSLILIGCGGLLWHAHRRGITEDPPDRSMDIDPVTTDEEVAAVGYDCMIGSEFERENGFHANLLPPEILKHLPDGWEGRATRAEYSLLTVVVPSPADLLAPKIARGEPRDRRHAAWAARVGLVPKEGPR